MLALAPLLPTIVFSSIARVSIGSLFRDNFAIFSAKNAKFRKLNFWNFGLQNYCFSICESGYFAYAKKPNPNNLEAQFSAGHDVGLVWWWWGGGLVWYSGGDDDDDCISDLQTLHHWPSTPPFSFYQQDSLTLSGVCLMSTYRNFTWNIRKTSPMIKKHSLNTT